MGFISWIILGLICGAIAKAIRGDQAFGGWLGSMILGLLGGILGGFIGAKLLNWPMDSFFSIKTWVLAIGGSLIVLFLVGLLGRKKA